MPTNPTDAEDEITKRGLSGCTIPSLEPKNDKVIIDPIWLLDFLHKNAKDIKSIEINYSDNTIHLAYHDKIIEAKDLK